MKKITLMSCVFAMFAGTLCAESVDVTTTEMNVEKAGSLLYVIENASAETETTINFDFDGEELDYADGAGIAVNGKKLIFNGINKKNNKPVTIKGTKTLFKFGSAATITLNDLAIKNFQGIAMTLAGGVTLTVDRCLFENNFEPETAKKNNGGVMRINASTVTVKNSMFTKNRGGGSYGGGALCAYGAANLRVENCSFIQNVATSGAAIGVNATDKNASPKVYIVNSTFANNLSDDRGGAIYMQTATTVDVFAPVVVNCTFVGNINGNDGGAINVWSRATTSMKPVFVNNIFAANYRTAWQDKEELNDVWAYYLGGELDANGNPLAQTVFPTCKNNVYLSALEGFFDNTNKKVEFENIFKETEKNPLDEGDDYFNHKSSKLTGDMMVAMIAENSVARGAGIASLEGVEIPTVDQLGNARPATPSAGAVEYGDVTAIWGSTTENNAINVWNKGNQIFAEGIEGITSISVCSLAGEQIYKGTIQNGNPITLDIVKGIYIVKINNAAVKLTIK